MTTNQPYKLGICSGQYNVETLNQIIKNLEVPCQASVVKGVESPAASVMDTLYIINPVFDSRQKSAFLEYIENGGTACIMIDMSSFSAEASADLLSTLGVEIKGKFQSKRFLFKYLEGYPKHYKVGKRKVLVVQKISTFARFGLSKKGSLGTCIPLIAGQNVFFPFLCSVKVNYGKGALVVINSTHIIEDFVDIIHHLLTLNPDLRTARIENLFAELRAKVFAIINESFKIYQELPLEMVYRKTNAYELGVPPTDILAMVEELIITGDIYAAIRGDVLVRY